MNELHAGKTKSLTERSDCWRDCAKVFGNEWKSTTGAFNRSKEFGAGRWAPRTTSRSARSSRDFIRVHEADEVIDAQCIKARQACCNARGPPCKAGATMLAPAIVRMAPQLPGGAETVGRNSGHHFGATFSVKAKETRIVLNISGIERNKDRNIAKKQDIECSTARSKKIPLPLEFPLHPDVIRGVWRGAAL